MKFIYRVFRGNFSDKIQFGLDPEGMRERTTWVPGGSIFLVEERTSTRTLRQKCLECLWQCREAHAMEQKGIGERAVEVLKGSVSIS